MQTNRLDTALARVKIATVVLGLVTTAAAWLPPSVSAQTRQDDISFDLVVNPKFAACLRKTPNDEPRARARIIRGRQNDTLFLDLAGFKQGLNFDLFTVQRTPFLANKAPDPEFHGSFGLAWYQSDIHVNGDNHAHVLLKTILLDQIFGFDSSIGLNPINTFHLGFWFNNPEDAAACGFDPSKPTPFNGEHKAGPLAMISIPAPETNLGPLCTEVDPDHPDRCNP